MVELWTLNVVQDEMWILVTCCCSVAETEKGDNPQIYIYTVRAKSRTQISCSTPLSYLFLETEVQSIWHCPGVDKSDDMVIRHTCTVHSLDRDAAVYS